ncbi:MAG TPA: M14 family zinc carboxypeptidase [Gemmatimonadales bacterium]|nr:M14 family zinc carboxypeptidase [Gemmatimonadales bacterium]
MRLAPLALLAVLPVAPLSSQGFDFYTRGPYRPAVPRPEQITGYPAGSGQTMYAVLQHYLDTLVATAPERVRIERWGETDEHRPIRVLIISDPANLARLDEIRADMAALADPRKTTPARAAEIAARDPLVALFQYSVHGDEPAGLEAAMQVAYQLLASDEPATQDILKKVVLVLNPSANPDGHERFAAWSNSVAVGADDPAALEHGEPWSVVGRFSHLRFDMNRDLLAQSQRPVQAMVAGLLRWHPQVFVDHHSTTPTFFFPPDAPSVNLNLPAQSAKWFETFGRGNAAAFDQNGWQYFVRDEFDFFYVGYWDEWATFQGASGMTYETDGGPALAQRRDDGTISTFRDGIAHHYVASLATLATAAANRQQRISDYYDFRRSAMDEARTDRMKKVIIEPGSDPGMAAHVAGLLTRDGIEVTRLSQPATSALAHAYLGGAAGRHTFPAGSYVVDLSQPQRRLAKAILEPQPELQHDFVADMLARYQRNHRRGEDADKEGYGFYDITAWAPPFTFNLDAYWTEDAVATTGEALTDTVLPAPAAPARAASAYAFTDDNLAGVRLAFQLLAEGFKVAMATRPLRADGRTWPRGTFVVRIQRNPPSIHDRIAALAPALGVPVTPVQSAFADTGQVGVGSGNVVSVHAPAVLVAAGDGVSQTSYGAVWQFLKEMGLPFTPVPLARLGGMDDLAAYNVLIIPDGGAGRMRRELGEGGIRALKTWVGSGGALIGFGGAGELAANKDVGLSTLSDVGDSAKADTTPPGTVPQLSSPTAPSKEKPEELPGSIFRATLDRTHWLTVGYEQDQLPVFLDGGTFWKRSRAGANPVGFVGDSLTLSGFTWPDTERLLKGTAWAVVENQGDGHVVLFLSDPFFRAFWRGPARLVTNAMLLGPGR